jgi:hypothetical protein
MSAMLDSLLNHDRLADCIRNDIAAGIAPPPPVEMDEEFFARVDLEYARDRRSGKHERDRQRRALQMQQQREGAAI